MSHDLTMGRSSLESLIDAPKISGDFVLRKLISNWPLIQQLEPAQMAPAQNRFPTELAASVRRHWALSWLDQFAPTAPWDADSLSITRMES